MNSTYWSNSILNSIFLSGQYNFFLGLSSTMPSRDGTGVSEPAAEDYHRVKIACFSTAIDGSICNMEDIRFPRSRKTWFADEVPAAYWTVYDGESEDSNLLMFGNLSEPSGIRANVIATVPAGELMINMNDLT